ncbi:MAG: RDD family protein [Chloroflexota bacterium]|nr:RDD family protein [Chloroflexota bacterium]
MPSSDKYSSRIGNYAGFVTRLIAWIIDRLFIIAVTFVIGWIANFVLNAFPFENDTYRLVIITIAMIFDILFVLFYYIGLWMISGQTLGKSIMGLRVVRTNGERLKFRHAVIRYFGYFLSALLLFLGYLMVLVDNRRQALHDKLAGTIVVYSETWEERSEYKNRIRDHMEFRRQQRLAAEAAESKAREEQEGQPSVLLGG